MKKLGAELPFKLFHVIRDPVELVISDYWYHLRQPYKNGDYGFIKVTSEGLQAKNMTAGMTKDAESVLKQTLKHMAANVAEAQDDPRFLTVGLEDFTLDYNKTIRCMYSFFLGPEHPNLQKLVDLAARANEAEWTRQQLKQHTRHVNTEEHKDQSRAYIDTSPDPLWDVIRSYRPELGYIEVKPGVFRRDPKLSCDRPR